MEEAYIMGFNGGFEQGKLMAALPELWGFIPVKEEQVNRKA